MLFEVVRLPAGALVAKRHNRLTRPTGAVVPTQGILTVQQIMVYVSIWCAMITAMVSMVNRGYDLPHTRVAYSQLVKTDLGIPLHSWGEYQ